MFLRYFWLVSLQDDDSKSEVGSREGSPSTLPTKDEADEDFELPIWDTAIACLAISVKVCDRGHDSRRLWSAMELNKLPSFIATSWFPFTRFSLMNL
jgi:hypothetical protein